MTSPKTTRDYIVLMVRIGHLLTKRLNQTLVSKHKVTFHQVSILFAIRFHPDMTMQQLAERLTVSLPNVLSIIERLKKDGYLITRRSRTDKRKQHLHLTRKAVSLMRRLQTMGEAPELKDIDQFFKDLPKQQRTQFQNTLVQTLTFLVHS